MELASLGFWIFHGGFACRLKAVGPDPREDPKSTSLNGGSCKEPSV